MKLSQYKMTKLFTLIFIMITIIGFSGCNKSTDKEHQNHVETSEDSGGYYTCSMHPQVIEKEPGNCPICGMKLVFVEGKEIRNNHDGQEGGEGHDEAAEMYVCPMHPQVTGDKPGKCPICGMDLMKMEHKPEDAAAAKKAVESGSFRFSIAPRVLTNSNLLTTPAKKEKFTIKADYTGEINYNEDPDSLVIVNTKYDGWVESLYVSKEGVAIGKGQRIMGLYSPSLLAAKEEYVTTWSSMKDLYAAQGKTAEALIAAMKSDATVQASRQKLKYLDVSETEIRQIEMEGKTERLTYFYSPIRGIVIKKNILQGAFISSGQELLRIADLNVLWVYINVFEKDLSLIRKGQKATIKSTAFSDRDFKGVVDLIYPYLNPETKDIKVRIILPNTGGQLKPGMFTQVSLEDTLPGEVIVIPDTAIIHSGEKNYVFVSLGAGNFELRPVQIRISSDGKSVISGGLGHNELVVVNGQFLLDSEASLKEAVSKGRAAAHVH